MAFFSGHPNDTMRRICITGHTGGLLSRSPMRPPLGSAGRRQMPTTTNVFQASAVGLQQQQQHYGAHGIPHRPVYGPSSAVPSRDNTPMRMSAAAQGPGVHPPSVPFLSAPRVSQSISPPYRRDLRSLPSSPHHPLQMQVPPHQIHASPHPIMGSPGAYPPYTHCQPPPLPNYTMQVAFDPNRHEAANPSVLTPMVYDEEEKPLTFEVEGASSTSSSAAAASTATCDEQQVPLRQDFSGGWSSSDPYDRRKPVAPLVKFQRGGCTAPEWLQQPHPGTVNEFTSFAAADSARQKAVTHGDLAKLGGGDLPNSPSTLSTSAPQSNPVDPRATWTETIFRQAAVSVESLLDRSDRREMLEAMLRWRFRTRYNNFNDILTRGVGDAKDDLEDTRVRAQQAEDQTLQRWREAKAEITEAYCEESEELTESIRALNEEFAETLRETRKESRQAELQAQSQMRAAVQTRVVILGSLWISRVFRRKEVQQCSRAFDKMHDNRAVMLLESGMSYGENKDYGFAYIASRILRCAPRFPVIRKQEQQVVKISSLLDSTAERVLRNAFVSVVRHANAARVKESQEAQERLQLESKAWHDRSSQWEFAYRALKAKVTEQEAERRKLDAIENKTMETLTAVTAERDALKTHVQSLQVTLTQEAETQIAKRMDAMDAERKRIQEEAQQVLNQKVAQWEKERHKDLEERERRWEKVYNALLSSNEQLASALADREDKLSEEKQRVSSTMESELDSRMCALRGDVERETQKRLEEQESALRAEFDHERQMIKADNDRLRMMVFDLAGVQQRPSTSPPRASKVTDSFLLRGRKRSIGKSQSRGKPARMESMSERREESTPVAETGAVEVNAVDSKETDADPIRGSADGAPPRTTLAPPQKEGRAGPEAQGDDLTTQAAPRGSDKTQEATSVRKEEDHCKLPLEAWQDSPAPSEHQWRSDPQSTHAGHLRNNLPQDPASHLLGSSMGYLRVEPYWPEEGQQPEVTSGEALSAGVHMESNPRTDADFQAAVKAHSTTTETEAKGVPSVFPEQGLEVAGGLKAMSRIRRPSPKRVRDHFRDIDSDANDEAALHQQIHPSVENSGLSPPSFSAPTETKKHGLCHVTRGPQSPKKRQTKPEIPPIRRQPQPRFRKSYSSPVNQRELGADVKGRRPMSSSEFATPQQRRISEETAGSTTPVRQRPRPGNLPDATSEEQRSRMTSREEISQNTPLSPEVSFVTQDLRRISRALENFKSLQSSTTHSYARHASSPVARPAAAASGLGHSMLEAGAEVADEFLPSPSNGFARCPQDALPTIPQPYFTPTAGNSLTPPGVVLSNLTNQIPPSWIYSQFTNSTSSSAPTSHFFAPISSPQESTNGLHSRLTSRSSRHVSNSTPQSETARLAEVPIGSQLGSILPTATFTFGSGTFQGPSMDTPQNAGGHADEGTHQPDPLSHQQESIHEETLSPTAKVSDSRPTSPESINGRRVRERSRSAIRRRLSQWLGGREQ